MSSTIDACATLCPLRRPAYERLVALGMFAGERLELLDGSLVVREPQGSAPAADLSGPLGGVGRVRE